MNATTSGSGTGRFLRASVPLGAWLLAVLLVACSSPSEVEEGRAIALLMDTAEDPAVVVPDTVTAGEEFTVSVRVEWPDGCGDVDPDGPDVHLEGALAAIIPYVVLTRGGYCLQLWISVWQDIVLRFDEPGPAQVLFYGRPEPRSRNLVAVERTVVVR